MQVIGVPDKQYGEEIMACVILKDGESMTEEEMQATMCSTHMAKHKVPRYVDFVDGVPDERRRKDPQVQNARGCSGETLPSGRQRH